MTRFNYIRADNLDHAISLLNEPGRDNQLLAGGTDLLPGLREKTGPRLRLVDISRINELKLLRESDDEIIIGSGVTFSEIINNKIIQTQTPHFVSACKLLGGPQIRNVGTIGGNIANAAACADSVPVLISLDAIVHLKGINGIRKVILDEFIIGTNKTGIKAGEIITHVSFKIPEVGIKTSFIKVSRRNSLAISRMTVACIGRVSKKGDVEQIRLCLGAVYSTTRRVRIVEKILLNHYPSTDLINLCGQKAMEDVQTENGERWSSEYKIPVVNNLTIRSLKEVFINNPTIL